MRKSGAPQNEPPSADESGPESPLELEDDELLVPLEPLELLVPPELEELEAPLREPPELEEEDVPLEEPDEEAPPSSLASPAASSLEQAPNETTERQAEAAQKPNQRNEIMRPA